MTIQTNTQNRKALAQQISQLTGDPVQYMGVPSCAYQVGPYTILKDGSIEGEDITPIQAFLVANGYIEELEGSDTDPEEEETIEAQEEINRTSVSIPISECPATAVISMLKMLYARQKLIGAMMNSDMIRVDEELINRLNDEKPQTIDQIQKILKEELSIGMVTGIGIHEGKLEMAFPFDESNPTQWTAYAEILMAIARRAKTAQNVRTALIDPAEDEMKYFCRNWLVQLGMGGPDFKAIRSVLLDHLHGYAAFRTADKMQAHKEKYAALRRDMREMEQAEVTTDD